MRDGSELHRLQFIGIKGDKRFLIGGRVAGCYLSIGDVNGATALCICEGFATGASIHEATGYPVVVAFNAGNLLPVAKAMRKRFPELHLIVCGDDDTKMPGNPGRTKAAVAAPRRQISRAGGSSINISRARATLRALRWVPPTTSVPSSASRRSGAGSRLRRRRCRPF